MFQVCTPPKVHGPEEKQNSNQISEDPGCVLTSDITGGKNRPNQPQMPLARPNALYRGTGHLWPIPLDEEMMLCRIKMSGKPQGHKPLIGRRALILQIKGPYVLMMALGQNPKQILWAPCLGPCFGILTNTGSNTVVRHLQNRALFRR